MAVPYQATILPIYEAAVGLTRVAKYNVSSSHPDGEVGEAVEVGVGAGSAVEASVSSAMAQSLQGCTLTLLNKNSHQADWSGKQLPESPDK